MSDINNVLSILDAINKENTVSLYVPSLKREVKFKSISTGQQKLLLKAAVDNPIFQTRFIIAIHNIITENCTEKDILSTFTTIDSLCVLLQYRIENYGSGYTFEQDNIDYSIDLSSFKERVKEITVPASEIFTFNNITIRVGPPTLNEQYSLEKQIREKRTEDTTINESLGEAFIGEISKFIKEINITVDNKTQDIGYKDLSFTKKYLVLEKLPAAVVKGIIAYLENVAAIQRKITRVEGTDSNGNIRELDITIDASLFSIT